MYSLFHLTIGFLYILPSLFVEIYTKPYYTEIDLIYEFINPRNIIVGVIWCTIHFVINYIFIKRKTADHKFSIYYPIKVMIVFGLAYYINSLRNNLTYIHTNHPGFYILMISTIFWSLVSYVICILFYGMHTKNHLNLHKNKIGFIKSHCLKKY